MSARELGALRFERGRILCLKQWYRGFEAVLLRVAAQAGECPAHPLMAEPHAILCMFDKPACRARLREAGVAVPPALGPVASYDELLHRMMRAKWSRVFVKPAHGSSATGVVAYQTNGRDHAATTTVEMVGQGGELKLYNSRRVRTYRDRREIAMLIDALCAHRVHVERWLPKAGIDGRAFDLRVVVIGGRARHVVVRTSRTPMTNLHLLNQRGEASRVRARMGEGAWGAAMESCEAAMRCFPRSLHGGVDLLIGTDLRAHAVLEVNAFGDLLPGVTCDGLDTYEAEIEDALARDEPAPLTTGPAALARGGVA